MLKQAGDNSGEWTTPPLADVLRAAEPAEDTKDSLPLHEPNDSAAEGYDGTLLMVECQPEWSDRPLLKLDFPEMGYLSYKVPPAPPHS